MIITLRRGNIKDAEAMGELDRLCFPTPWSKAAFEEEFSKNPFSFYVVAEYEGELLGYGGLWDIKGEGHITNFAVHPDYRQRGMGTAILKELLELTEERGISSYTLEVRPSNKEAIGLYEKFGFKPGGIRKEYYADNREDALILWRGK